MSPVAHTLDGPGAAAAAPAHRPRGRRPWVRTLLGGLALWVAAVIVTFATRNPNLVPTIILLGSFLVPVTFVVYAFQRADQIVTGERVFTAFVYGGVLGVLGASLLEAAFLKRPSPLAFAGVGLIEEAVKLAALWLIARRLPRYTVRDGMVLGAAVGFGFAALESAGYAFTALFTANGLSLVNVVETEVLRGLLAPVGHGLWTAILGGVIFAATRNGHWRLTSSVVRAYVGVVILHALWDSMSMIAIYVTGKLTAAGWEGSRMWENGYLPSPTGNQLHLHTAINWIGLILVSTIGLFWLGTLRRRVEAEERDEAETERLRERMAAAAAEDDAEEHAGAGQDVGPGASAGPKHVNVSDLPAGPAARE